MAVPSIELIEAGSSSKNNLLTDKEHKKSNQKKKKLILDLDGTLVAILMTQPKVKHSVVHVQRGNSKASAYVIPRKGLRRFLKTLNMHFEIQLFTSSVKEVYS